MVIVATDFTSDGDGVHLKRGLRGKVVGLDDDTGDAYVQFEQYDQPQWVFKPNFHNLDVGEGAGAGDSPKKKKKKEQKADEGGGNNDKKKDKKKGKGDDDGGKKAKKDKKSKKDEEDYADDYNTTPRE
eukprot:gene49581-28398_t